MIIGLSGRAGSGKTTVADALLQKQGFVRHKFAKPLKDMLRAIGLAEYQIEGGLKQKPCDLLLGKTPREAMQSLGTEWGRKCIGNDFWVNAWRATLPEVCEWGFGVENIVVDDVRFPNEFAAIKDLGGAVFLVERDGAMKINNHESENSLDGYPFDGVLINEGGLDEFVSLALEAIGEVI